MADTTALPSVLIVDDDEEIRRILHLLFEFEEFVIVGEATNGFDAIPLVTEQLPDLVILDHMMPRMSGEKTAEAIRHLLPSARIVAFSAVLTEKPQWADAYLNKDRVFDIAPLLSSLLPERETLRSPTAE